MRAAEMTAILSAAEAASAERSSLEALQVQIVRAIAGGLPHYDWVGFYMLDPSDPSMLVLGPFVGAPSPHVRIPVTEGICGAAVADERTIIVDDVRADPRYLACSIDTRSEIVVPIWVHGAVVGEIDVDSHTAAAFGAEDRAFLESCARIIASHIERQANSVETHQ